MRNECLYFDRSLTKQAEQCNGASYADHAVANRGTTTLAGCQVGQCKFS